MARSLGLIMTFSNIVWSQKIKLKVLQYSMRGLGNFHSMFTMYFKLFTDEMNGYYTQKWGLIQVIGSPENT